MKELHPMGLCTFAIACACCKNNGKDTDPERCARCKAEKESGFEVGEFPQIGRRWIPVTERLPVGDNQVLVVASGKPRENIELVHAVEIASLYSDGWCLETWPEWAGAAVTHWMPLPSAPEVEL